MARLTVCSRHAGKLAVSHHVIYPTCCTMALSASEPWWSHCPANTTKDHKERAGHERRYSVHRTATGVVFPWPSLVPIGGSRTQNGWFGVVYSKTSLIPSNTSRQNISGSSCCPWRSVPPLPCFIWHPQRKNSQQGVRSRGCSLAWCVGVDPTGQNAVRQISLRIKRYCKNPTVPEALVFTAWILRLSVHGSVLRTTVHGGNTERDIWGGLCSQPRWLWCQRWTGGDARSGFGTYSSLVYHICQDPIPPVTPTFGILNTKGLSPEMGLGPPGCTPYCGFTNNAAEEK